MAKANVPKVLKDLDPEKLKAMSEDTGSSADDSHDDQADEDLQAAMDALESEDADVDPNLLLDSVATSEELLERETTIGTKSSQSGNYNLDSNITYLQSEDIGGTLSKVDDDTFHYSGSLGTFDYNPKDWSVGTKTITAGNGDVKTTIPVFRYIGDATAGNDVEVPEGVKNLDYTFEGNTKLETVPYLPDSVESAHAAFMGCTNITRASKDAKEGEHEGGFDIVGWTAGGATAGATVGAGAGAVVGSVPGAGIGAGIGGVVGGVGGAIKGTYDFFTKDGKGGTWTMPPNLKDSSNMFDGCVKLTEGYEAASDELINAREMYSGNKNIGTDEYATKHGSVSVTDFSDSKLSKEAVQGSYSGANVEVTKDLKGNYSKDWDEDSGTMNKSGLTDKEKQEVEELSETLKAEDVRNGVVETDMSVETDGLAYDAKKRTENGYRTTTNVNDTNAKQSESFGSVAGLIDRGIVSFAEFKLLKMVTGSTLLSAGITFGGQMLGILPSSMKPVLTTVAGFVGEDNPVGKALNGIADKLPDTGTTMTASASSTSGKKKESASGLVASVGNRMESSMKDPLVLTAKGSLSYSDVEQSMCQNAKKMVQDGVFYDLMQDSSGNVELDNMSRVALLTGAAMEERAISLAGETGSLSDDQKKMFSRNVMGVMRGLESYSKTAYAEIPLKYGSDVNDALDAENGVGRVMSITVEPLYKSIQELDEKYKFLSEADKKELNEMKLSPGVPTYEEYCNGVDFSPNKALDEMEAREALKSEGYSDEDIQYANAGLDDDKSNAKSDDAAAKSNTASYDVSDSKQQSDNSKSKMTREQRLALAGITDDTDLDQAASDGVICEYE